MTTKEDLIKLLDELKTDLELKLECKETWIKLITILQSFHLDVFNDVEALDYFLGDFSNTVAERISNCVVITNKEVIINVILVQRIVRGGNQIICYMSD